MTGPVTRTRRRTAAQRPAPAPLRRWLWAVAQLAVLGGEVFLLLFMLAQPAFRARAVQVQGAHHLSSAEITAALALPANRSIFLVSRSALESRLEAVPWVRSASVSLALPDRVQVAVSEWSPVAVLTQGELSYYLNAQGTVLAPTGEAGPLPVIDVRGLGSIQPGRSAVDPELIQMLIPVARGFEAAFRIRALSFSLDAQAMLTLRTDRGWTIVFGQMATHDQRATLETKLGALRALAARLDFTTAPLQYVNLMNPKAPAVLMTSR
jgi:cell division protein FtsQ